MLLFVLVQLLLMLLFEPVLLLMLLFEPVLLLMLLFALVPLLLRNKPLREEGNVH